MKKISLRLDFVISQATYRKNRSITGHIFVTTLNYLRALATLDEAV